MKLIAIIKLRAERRIGEFSSNSYTPGVVSGDDGMGNELTLTELDYEIKRLEGKRAELELMHEIWELHQILREINQ